VNKIGTLKESSLHRALKFRYSGDGGGVEALAGSYVCDACTGSGELVEVQTGSFGPLKEKAKNLCKENKLRIIHPIIIQKTIELYTTDGSLIHRRKSPRKGSEWDLFDVLIYAPELPLTKNLTIELAVVDIVEKRVNNSKGSWRRKGVSIADKYISAWRHSVILKTQKDYLRFLPFRKKERFTTRDLAEKAKISANRARQVLYVFTKTRFVERVGKQGRAFLYERR